MSDKIGLFLTGVLLGCYAGVYLAYYIDTQAWHAQTIAHLAAHYDAATGAWEWNDGEKE